VPANLEKGAAGGIVLLLLLLLGNCNYTEGAALSYESVYPLITILYYVVSL